MFILNTSKELLGEELLEEMKHAYVVYVLQLLMLLLGGMEEVSYLPSRRIF